MHIQECLEAQISTQTTRLVASNNANVRLFFEKLSLLIESIETLNTFDLEIFQSDSLYFASIAEYTIFVEKAKKLILAIPFSTHPTYPSK